MVFTSFFWSRVAFIHGDFDIGPHAVDRRLQHAEPLMDLLNRQGQHAGLAFLDLDLFLVGIPLGNRIFCRLLQRNQPACASAPFSSSQAVSRFFFSSSRSCFSFLASVN